MRNYGNVVSIYLYELQDGCISGLENAHARDCVKKNTL